ncbi:macoilin-like [Clytia hemisphaerica]|uniref:Macoilin n=1 Tax=Clytia hemisphaerica TaxID=252671 RepID=A0A7M5TWF5_9CNID
MKRRTIDASKLRRPTKRSRITDSVNGSWLLYLRFFVVWLLIITVDFALEFRIEFLWPFWLLIKSSFDSFRYQGMALTLLFLCITLLSDVICFMFLPLHWLFFVASTYVWVQFVITTERGPCLATVALWLLFVYVEASVRLREIKSLPFNLDICRPFAAHCIGYPVVSLGYGFKSFVGYKVKNYKKTEVSHQNDFYQQLVSYALPIEVQSLYNEILIKKPLVNGINSKTDIDTIFSNDTRNKKNQKSNENDEKSSSSLSLHDLETISSIPSKDSNISSKRHLNHHDNYESGFVRVTKLSSNLKSNGDVSGNKQQRSSKHNKQPKAPAESDYELDISDSEESTSSSRLSHDNSPKSHRSATIDNLQNKLKEEQVSRRRSEQQVCQMECDMKKLRSDLHSVRQTESEFRTQVNSSLIAERYMKAELDQLKSDNENLQQKISSFNSNKSQDKSLISSLERKLKNERDNRAQLESQLKESKKKSTSESPSDLKLANHNACNARNNELEADLQRMQAKLDEANRKMEALKKVESNRKHNENDTEKIKKEFEILTNALNAMQGKNLHLENSLSSETRLKLDLFSALGDTRRQLEIAQDRMKEKCKEVEMLKGKIAEVMAVMPPQYHSSISSFGNGGGTGNGSAIPVSSQSESKSSFITKKSADPVVTSASFATTNGIA